MLWTNLALPCVAGTQSFEKSYENRLMQSQAMEITAGRAMQHRAILCDFASPDSQIAMETSISGCRMARFCFTVAGLLQIPSLTEFQSLRQLNFFLFFFFLYSSHARLLYPTLICVGYCRHLHSPLVCCHGTKHVHSLLVFIIPHPVLIFQVSS